MEYFWPFIIVFWIIRFIIWVIRKASGSGGGSFSGGIPFSFKLAKSKSDSNSNEDILKVSFRGYPRKADCHLGFSISIFDITDGSPEPVLSTIPELRESSTKCFELKREICYLETGYGWEDWIDAGMISSKYLDTPSGGDRKLRIIARLINLSNPPMIINGEPAHGDSSKILWKSQKTRTIKLPNKGYNEDKKVKNKARSLSIQIGVAVAMSDGDMDSSEANVIKDWIVNQISSFDLKEKNKLKSLYNKAFKSSFEKAQSNVLDFRSIAKDLKKLNMVSCEYEAIELCYKIMVADGKVDANETKTLDSLAKILSVKPSEVDKIREGILTGTDYQINLPIKQQLETLGIDTSLPKYEIKQKLASEYQKWVNRYNIVDIKKRDDVQKMIEKISKARKDINTAEDKDEDWP